MAYMHIDNLYKNQEILMFLECYAMEKIHGTSAHITFTNQKDSEETGRTEPPKITFFSGGEKHENFIKLFNAEELIKKFIEIGFSEATIYGEAYGGRQQGMKETYGDKLKFIAFDIKLGHTWLNVQKAKDFCDILEIEFVAYEKIPTILKAIDKERDRDSRQAIRNGIEEPKMQEGIVLRPLIELKKNNGARIISKHKRDEFKETNRPRKVQDPEKMKILSEANVVAEEWVTFNRMKNILSHIDKEHSIEIIGEVIKIMIEDIKREGDKEVVWSKPVERAIGKLTAKMTKEYFDNKLREGAR